MSVTDASEQADGGGSPHGEVKANLLPPVSERDFGYELDIVALLRIVWKQKLVVAVWALVAGTVALGYVLAAVPWYRAEVVLAPAHGDSGQGLASQLSRLGGIAGLAGLSMGSVNSAEPVAVLRSRSLARQFVEAEGLTREIASRSSLPRGLRAFRDDKEPDVRDAVEYFDRHIRLVAEDRKTGLVTLSVQSWDPELAAMWATRLVSLLNSSMRERAIDESQRNIEFLQEQLKATQIVTVQLSMARLLESEVEKLMIAQGNEEFAFRVIDEAQVPLKSFKPRRLVTVLASLLLGACIGSLHAVVRHRRART